MSKKLLSLFIAAILCAAISVPVLACGSHGSKATATASYTFCDIESCVKSSIHSHNGKYYYAHSYKDGHEYHEYCDIEDCTLSGYHNHDSTYCFGHTANDGHNYHSYCEIENCNLTDYHEHNGNYCFGHNANDGHNYHRMRSNHH